MPPQETKDSTDYQHDNHKEASQFSPNGYYLANYSFVCTALGFYFGGWWAYSTVFFNIFLSLAELFLEDDNSFPTKEQAKVLQKQCRFRPLYVHTFLFFASMCLAPYYFQNGGYSIKEMIGLIVSFGYMAFGQVTIDHELYHSKNKFEQELAFISTAVKVGTNYLVEHNHGHHWYVGTSQDPSTAKFGETVWERIPKVAIGAWKNAWRIEHERLFKLGKSVISLENRNIRGLVIMSFSYSLLITFVGFRGAIFWLLSSILGMIVLFSINYLEHYGLERKKLPNGSYEPVSSRHSWDAHGLFTNSIYFRAQRHADHHAFNYKSYHMLTCPSDSPTYPAGLSGMLYVCMMAPPLFFRLVNPLLLEYQKKWAKADMKSVQSS